MSYVNPLNAAAALHSSSVVIGVSQIPESSISLPSPGLHVQVALTPPGEEKPLGHILHRLPATESSCNPSPGAHVLLTHPVDDVANVILPISHDLH